MNTAWNKPTKYLVGVGLVIFTIYLLHLSRSVISLLVIARPVINWLQTRLRLKHGLAVAVSYLGVLILVPLVMLLAVPAIIDALGYVISLENRGFYQRTVESFRSSLLSLKAAQLPGPGVDAYVDQTIDAVLLELQPPSIQTILRSLGAAVTATFDAAAGLVGALFSQIATMIFLFLASIYISLDAPNYRPAFLRLIPLAYQPEIDWLLTRIVRLWNSYFRGQLTLMLVFGVLSWFGLSALVVMTGVLVGASVGGVLGALLAAPVIATGSEILRYIYHKMRDNEPYHPEEAASALDAGIAAGWRQQLSRFIPSQVLRFFRQAMLKKGQPLTHFVPSWLRAILPMILPKAPQPGPFLMT